MNKRQMKKRIKQQLKHILICNKAFIENLYCFRNEKPTQVEEHRLNTALMEIIKELS